MATVQIPAADYNNLRATVEVLERRVALLENHIDANARRASAIPDVSGLQEELLKITQNLFPGEVSIEFTDDPEYPQDSYTVVRAQASGKIKEIEDRRIEWHERVTQLSESCRLLRLSLDYQS